VRIDAMLKNLNDFFVKNAIIQMFGFLSLLIAIK